VLGNRAQALSTVPDPLRPDRMQLALATKAGPVALSSTSVGGQIGGLLEFRTRVLDPARAELGRIATAFASSFNARNRPASITTAMPAPRSSRCRRHA
jgi:flagellar hook-associated protein 1 FlgK